MAENLKFDPLRFGLGEMPTRLRNGFKVLKVVELPKGLAQKNLSGKYPILAWVDYDGFVEVEGFTVDGKYYEGEESDMDLVHEPMPRDLLPLCFPDLKTYKLWKSFAERARETVSPCDDCSEKYKMKMERQERCHPDMTTKLFSIRYDGKPGGG